MSEAAQTLRPKVLVSACLLGQRCRYDGGTCTDQVLQRDLEERGLEPVAFCPEESGGLSTPRPSAWLTASAEQILAGHGKLVTNAGRDVTAEFRAGAQSALELCQREQITRAFLKERSPSCGCQSTYVDGELTSGPGLTTATLRQAGVECLGIEGLRALPMHDANAKLVADDVGETPNAINDD